MWGRKHPATPHFSSPRFCGSAADTPDSPVDAHDRQDGSDDLAVSPVIPLVRFEEDVRSDGVRRHAEGHQKDRPQEALFEAG
mgnify:CR=1 FL=1